MAYTREIELDQETEDKLCQYIIDELFTHYAERNDYVADLLRWQKEYWAKPTSEEATFPFRGAATVIVPLNAISVEAIHSKNMMTRFALPHLVSVHAVSKDWDDAAAPFERFMNRELLDVMKVRNTFGDCYLECEKYGTMVGKVGYEKMVRTSIRQIGDREEEVDVTLRDGAQFDAVPLARFLMPYTARDPQTAPWCGEEHSDTPYNVMMLESGGAFKPGTIIDGPDWETKPDQMSKLHAWINGTANLSSPLQGNEFERRQQELEHTTAMWPKRIDWQEIWLPWDVDKSGKLKEIVVCFHYESRTFMSIRYNPHSDLRRPYRIGQYFPVEHRWHGIGICKMNEQFQKEITVQHRQRIDNATIANMRMFKINKLSGYGPKEPIFPGKMWFLDDMSHIDSVQLGEIYPSSFSNEQATLIYQQQRVGVNEMNLGMPQAGTPGTATSDLARIQEGNKKTDFVYDNQTSFTEEIITDIADIIQQYGPRQVQYFDTAEHGQIVKKLLDVPQGYIRDGLLIKLKASTQKQNEMLDRQNWVQLAPMIQQYYEGMLQLAMQLGDKQLEATILMKGMGAATEVLEQVLETFDIRNIDRITVSEILEKVKNGLQGLGAGQDGSGQPAPVGPPPGMDNISKALQLAGTLGNGGPNRIQGR